MFQNPLGLLALLAVPAIVALHLYRRRFRPRVVSALFLWTDEDRTPVSGRNREKLRASTSLVCEVLAAVLLALLLASPRACDGSTAEHLVVALDGSASMDARGSDGRSARERGTEAIAARIKALPRGSRVSLVASGPRPRSIAGPAAFPEEALGALASWRPTAARHDLMPAVALCLQLVGTGRVLVVTDRHAPDEMPPEVETLAVGEALDNVGIANASRTRATRGGEKVFVTLASFAAAARTTHVALHGPDGREIAAGKPLTIEPGARASLEFALAADAGPVEVRIDRDALAIDDSAFLAPRPPRVVGVACDLEDEARAALGIDGVDAPLARWLALVDEAVVAPDPTTAHVLLSRAVGGGRATWSVVLRTTPAGGERKDYVGPFLVERRHPLLEGATLEGLVWSADPAASLAGIPLVSAGNVPLLAEERDGPRREITLNLDPSRSSLQRSPDWPIFLSNVVEERRRELPGAAATNIAVGGTFAWRATLAADDDGAPFVLRGAGSRREHPARDHVVYDEVDEPGFHAFERRGRALATIGVTFQDASESDLRARSSGTRPSSADAARGRDGGSPLEMALLAGIVALALFDWYVLARLAGRLASPRPESA